MTDIYMKEDKVTLKLFPVCRCGYIFRDGVTINKYINEAKGLRYSHYVINPSICPNCKRYIDGVAIDKDIVEQYQL